MLLPRFERKTMEVLERRKYIERNDLKNKYKIRNLNNLVENGRG